MNKFVCIVNVEGVQTICYVNAADMACCRSILADVWWSIEPLLWSIVDVTNCRTDCETISRGRVS